jgi:hypothetical protein
MIEPWVITSRLMNTVFSVARASPLFCARHNGVVDVFVARASPLSFARHVDVVVVFVARASPLSFARHVDVVVVFIARFPIFVARLYGLLRLSAMSSVPHTDIVVNTWLNENSISAIVSRKHSILTPLTG